MVGCFDVWVKCGRFWSSGSWSWFLAGALHLPDGVQIDSKPWDLEAVAEPRHTGDNTYHGGDKYRTNKAHFIIWGFLWAQARQTLGGRCPRDSAANIRKGRVA